jgi:hypothetical protein
MTKTNKQKAWSHSKKKVRFRSSRIRVIKMQRNYLKETYHL